MAPSDLAWHGLYGLGAPGLRTGGKDSSQAISAGDFDNHCQPAQFPFLANGNGIVPFPSLQRPVSCPPSGEHQASSGEDEHFIFPIDM